MAQRRMFSLKVVDTDKFLEMPSSARLLYYDLAMRADDDGFVNSPKKIIQMVGASVDDFKILCAKDYIIPFDSGVIVIKDWKIHNLIRHDRYTETEYKNEKKNLNLIDNKYVIPDDNRLAPQVRLGKGSIGKGSIGKDIVGKWIKNNPPTLQQLEDYKKEKQLHNIDCQWFLDYFTAGDWIDSKGNKVKNWKQKMQTHNKFNFNDKNDTRTICEIHGWKDKAK